MRRRRPDNGHRPAQARPIPQAAWTNLPNNALLSPMAILHLRHLTRYEYRKPVGFGEHRFMLRPKDALDQQVVSFDLAIDPGAVELRQVHDVFGNCVGVARFATASEVLSFESNVVVDHRPSLIVE